MAARARRAHAWPTHTTAAVLESPADSALNVKGAWQPYWNACFGHAPVLVDLMDATSVDLRKVLDHTSKKNRSTRASWMLGSRAEGHGRPANQGDGFFQTSL